MVEVAGLTTEREAHRARVGKEDWTGVCEAGSTEKTMCSVLNTLNGVSA